MQPYFLPYIGYFQLINAVDKFVIYDNIQFSKNGWINRNRILVNGKDVYITLPLQKASDFLDIDQRNLVGSFVQEKEKILRLINSAYKQAPYFDLVYPLLEKIMSNNESNLFKFIYNSLMVICEYLEIKTEFIISSSVPVNHSLKSQEKVIAICNLLNAQQYINPFGGISLYSRATFQKHNVALNFIETVPFEYAQFSNEFMPNLSIMDVLMFNSKDKVKHYVQSLYTVN